MAGFYNRYLGMVFQSPEPVFLQEPEVNPPGFGENMVSKEAYKLKLYEEAVELGVPAKRTWGVEKLRKAIHDYSA